MLLKIQWVIDEIKEEIRKYLETNDNENTTIQNLWDAKKAVFRGKFIVITGFPQETRKISNKQPTLPPKIIRKRGTKKPKQKEGYNKDQKGNK